MTVVRQLQQSIQSRGQASTQALNTGLEILLDSDLRQSLKHIDSPLHWLLGGKDSLVPGALAQVLEQEYAQKNVSLQPQASHAPFISQPDFFIKQVIAVAQQLRDEKPAFMR